MKASRSRIKNAIAKAERRKAGKPKQSKYEAKRFVPATPTAIDEALDRAAKFYEDEANG